MAPSRAMKDSLRDLSDKLQSMASGDSLSTEPIESLLLVLKNPVQIAEFSKFDSSTFHSFFENLFHFVLASKRDFLSKPKSKMPLTRLVKAGELVKLSISVGIPRIRQKTLAAVVDHITQVIAGPNGTQIEPILDNYGKALSDLVGFPSHVEHLATSEKARWHACIDFFIGAIHRAMPKDADELESMRQDSPRLGTPVGRSMTVRASSVLYSARGGDVARKGQLDDALDALQNLTIGSNAPLLDRLDELTEVALRVLGSGNGSLRSKIASFAIINNLLTVSKCEKETEARVLTQSLVPIIAYWWRSDKSDRDSALAGLRQEILKTIMLISPPLEYLVLKMADKETADELDQLLEGLWMEYSRRETKLQLDDITFSQSELMNGYLQHKFFGLKTHNTEAEQRWMLVYCIAVLESTLARYSRKSQEHARSDQDSRRKKRRTELHENRLLKRFNAGDTNIQFAALHILPFILTNQEILPEDLTELLQLLLELTNHKDSLVVSWSLISLACCALSYPDLAESRYWKQSWLIATRTVSILGTSRAACFLLHAIADQQIFPHHEIAEDVNGIVAAADVKGPALLCDTSITLMSRFMHLRNVKLPNASHATSNHIVRWLFLRWKPSEISRAPPASPIDITNLLCSCCGGLGFASDKQALVPGGSLFALHATLTSTSHFESYLLLLDDPITAVNSSQSGRQKSENAGTAVATDRTSSYATKKLILELLYPKLEEVGGICTEWSASISKGSTTIPLEIFDNFLSAVLIGALMIPHVLDINSSQATSMESVIQDLVDRGLAAALSSGDAETCIHHISKHVAPFMPRMNSLSIETLQSVHHGLYKLLMKISFCMEGGKISQDFIEVQDQMDLDDEFQSQSSRTTTVSTPTTSLRTLIHAQTSYLCFYSDIQSRLGLLREFHDDESQAGLVPAIFIEKLTDLSNDELLAKCAFITELFTSDLVTSVDTALLIIQRIGSILSKYAYTCCEISLVMCIDVIDGLTSIWRQDDDALSGAVGDLYYYLVNQALPSNMLSPRALISLSSLLFTLLKVYPGYGSSLELDSCRTTLFRIMENSSIEVKYFIADRIADLFDLFILAVHDEVFVDVLDRLPSDPAHTSGIAYRLLVLTRLACKWPTLLRRCVYHIFETPGKVQNANKHAERCMNDISRQLGLDSARDLFQLFSRQLLYTWMENDSPENIPYYVFDFEDVADLLKSAEADAVGLAFMRNQQTTQQSISVATGKSTIESLKSNFATVLAFSMVQVASTAAGKDHGEMRITQTLGNKVYTEAVYVNFVDIIFSFISLIDQDDSVEKVLAKFPDLVYASRNLKDIMAIAHSSSQLPPNQQPVFRAKYVIYELSRLCQGTQFQLHELWTPSLVVSIIRKLLNAVRPALGSLHACSILRKIRLIVALAGKVVFDSYCLEMLLTTIRTFVVDGECADDALGLSQYLLLGGQSHLEKEPSFLAGYALSTLVSLRVFLESSQSSTTQESQFRATMRKAQTFHDWFTKYLANANISFKSNIQKSAFTSITQAAGYTRSSGNSEKNTHESQLLLNILGDEGSADQLLDQSSRKLALSLLCGDFSMPAQVTDDIIDQDAQAIDYSSAVFKSCEAEGLSQNYLAWAGRVLGKSFAASGDLPDDMLRETTLQQFSKLSPNANGSEMAILSLLQELTANPDTQFAGLAEAALRSAISIAHAIDDSPLVVACQRSLREPLYLASKWNLYHSPPSETVDHKSTATTKAAWADDIQSSDWARNLSIYLVRCVRDSTLLGVLQPVLDKVHGFASKSLPFIIHLVLLFQSGEQQVVRQLLSDSIKTWFKAVTPENKDNIKLLINTVLYLRTQEFPNEATIADRLGFLSLDYGLLAQAASQCGMHKSALLFIEIAAWQSSKASRRASTSTPQLLDQRETLLSIFENIDDPDAYYGLPEEANLTTVLARVEYENEGSKTLAFRGAQLDSHIRMNDRSAAADSQALVNALSILGYAGLSHSLLQVQQDADPTFASIESTYKAATRLEMWNLPTISDEDHYAVNTYRAYQSISSATNALVAQRAVYDGLSSSMKALTKHGQMNASALRKQLGGLASLAELDELLNVADAANLDLIASNLDSRSQWMRRGVYEDVNQILSCRGTTLNVLAQHSELVGGSKLPQATLRQMQVSSLLLSSQIYRFHKANQESLNISTALANMIPTCEKLDLHVDAAITIEIANSLWDHGEIGSSIRMLQSVDQTSPLNRQAIPVKRADLLAKIGHKASVARLEKPRDIQKKYLEPALKDLDGESKTREAGLVFHQFAKFCDEQLQDADGLEDLGRLQSLKKAKSNEVQELQSLIATTKETQLRKKYNNVLGREKQWLELDHQELRRVEQTRAEFIRLSLENYLLSLAASDEHDNDALRFTALWLQRPDDEVTNRAVSRHLSKVPTRKFAGLMNQLTSRLQNDGSPFQKLLMDLTYNVCNDHPYHGMYQVWSGTNAKFQQTDEVAVMRVRATEQLAERLNSRESSAKVWTSISKTSRYYHAFAMDKDPKLYKAGNKLPLRNSAKGQNLMSCLSRYPIPPPTMHMEVSATKDYSHIPMVAKVDSTMTIASGISAPKIITLVGTDGKRYKQLVKGSHDDLRQDAIMEQVFAAVSSVLKLHRTTRQRNLGIRTYKVLPLTASSGLIEFVPNTIPLHEFLMPAHEKYYPRDLKGSDCRKEIYNVQGQSVEIRVSTYKKITERFHPVMKHFFMEHFIDPDEWFNRRLAYTRSTAAISILGHVLGLGDRHGHNILLDTKTGEVVHIDLGVAFEAGRILPVPELVPFRLTRDIVDGMGITKTEGVFRRCCEFTLDALREEQYSIMTILDVLRYDPLYTWTIAPLRMAKLQKNRHNDGSVAPEESIAENAKKEAKTGSKLNEPSEADRALEVVRKKLSKALSVSATVNDLINQATDERNLAVLYCGWSATSASRGNNAISDGATVNSSLCPALCFSTSSSSRPFIPFIRVRVFQFRHRTKDEQTRNTLLCSALQLVFSPLRQNFLQRHLNPQRSMQHDADQTSPSRRRPRLSSSSSSSPFTAKRPKFTGEPNMASAKAKGKLPAVMDADGSGRPSAFQPHTGAKKLVIKNLRKPANRDAQVEEYYQKTAAELDAALAAILAGTRPNAPLERLYRGVEDTCRRGRADTVYKLLNDHIVGHLQSTVLKRIRQRGDTSNVKVLANVLDEWKIWNKQTVLIRSTFSFLDRTYLLRESLPSINDMAITQFRRMLFPSSSSTRQKPFEGDVVRGICDLIEADRRGNDARDSELLRDSIMMLYVLGVYTKHFEPVFLATSTTYFQECGTTWNMSSLRDHISSCESLLQREDHRCMAFNIDSTTEKLLMQVAHTVLIEEYVDKLLHKESLSHLLEDKDIKSMKGLYELLKLSNLQSRMKQPWGKYVKATGASIISDKEKGEEMVIRLLDLRRSLDLFIRDSFVKDEEFLYEMREAFAKFMNDRQIASCWNSGTSKIGEMTAKHVDMLLRGGLKALPKQLLSDVQDRATAEKEGLSSTGDEDAELDRQLDQALELFRFIEGKDAFEAFYKKDLARRLLMGRSASKDAERNMLTKLRGECGANFTHNLEQMFKDQDIAKDEMDSFREHIESLGEDKPAVDLHVMVLSAAAWPTYPDVPITVPAAVAKQMERFDGHYKNTHTGRALKWKHSLAHCSVKGVFPKGSKELLVSAFQAIVLLMFNKVGNDDALSYDEISQGTGLKEGDLDRTLQSLACGKVRVLTKHPKGRDVKPTDTFTFNKAFSDPKYRVKINQIQLKETKEENKATHERIEQDRRFETQAAIVRVMKSRKTMGHSELVAEVINLTKKRGSVEPAAIKKEIESLIDKDYLEREGNTYTYQA